MPVQHTIDAANVFDRICYEKGACFIRQMGHFFGKDVLLFGYREYIRKFAFKNTDLNDFIDCLEQALQDKVGKEKSDTLKLREWALSWLKESGVNEIEAKLAPNEAWTYRIEFKQRYPKHGDKRFHE